MKRPNISMPGSKGGGPSDPILKTHKLLLEIFSEVPMPVASTESSRTNAALLGIHILHLLKGCGLLNGTGFHSAAVALFRPMEDALDCLAAVSMVPGAAEKWQNGKLKASDAAKLWTNLVNDVEARNMPLSEYRKCLRRDFNTYSHCSPDLCNWNLYFKPFPDSSNKGTLELNQVPYIIDSNGHSIDAYETAHLLELIHVVKEAYSHYLSVQKDIFYQLVASEGEVEKIMIQHDKNPCHEVRMPPEIAGLEN